MREKIRVGIIGCGKISDAYFIGCRQYKVLEIVWCADLDLDRARSKAREYSVPNSGSVEHLLANPSLDLVVNLTIPQAHANINEGALRAGKHVYVEKPFALSTGDGQRILSLAKIRGLLVGCAPDTFLGSSVQTARQLLDQGAIGTPISGNAFWLSRGHESWHPAPDFYYQPGGGPLFDMGPYYLSALITLLGPVSRVSGFARRTFAQREIPGGVRAGTKIPVSVPTHYMGTLEFGNSLLVSIMMSFDVVPIPLPRIVLFGTTGTLELPDPNHFDGDVRLRRLGDTEFATMPTSFAAGRSRGTGVADLAYSILKPGRPVRASGDLAQHVLEVMAALDEAAAMARPITMASAPIRPAPMPAGVPNGLLDP